MSDPFLGMILPFPYQYAPQGWSFCQGQQLSISQYSALYSLLSVTFGGDAKTYFNLPDMRSRHMIGTGRGPGLSGYALGQAGGNELVTLTVNQMPLHSHDATFTGTGGSAGSPLSVTISVSQNVAGNVNIPNATHNILGGAETGSNEPANLWSTNVPTPSVSLGGVNVQGGGGGITGGTVSVKTTGGSQSTDIRNPFLALNFCIALEGNYPMKSQ